MILLLGATGYIGEAFAQELRARNESFHALSRTELDYTHFESLLQYLHTHKPAFLINVAGYTGKPNVDACELEKAGTILGNVALPQTIAHACAAAKVPWGHVSSGCIYSGAKILDHGNLRTEKDLTTPELRSLVANHQAAILGFTETDTPNFTFANGPCSFYSGTKALGEQVMTGIGQNYIWRLRIPFDEIDGSRNYLSKVQRYSKVYDNVNSISHRADFVKACLDLWKLRAPFGTYNVTNPGFVTTRQVVEQIEKLLKPAKKFEYWHNDQEFYQTAAKTPRSNCVLDNSKLLATGVKIRSVEAALADSLQNWKPE
jgi:UDP-glucose 4,6-dehydratase